MTTTEIIRELQRRRGEETDALSRARAEGHQLVADSCLHRKAVLCEVLQWILENQIEHVSEVIESEAEA